MMQRSGVELVLDQSKFDLGKLADKAKAADKAIDGISDAADRAESALRGIPSNVDVMVDTDFSSVGRAQDEIDTLSQTEDVTVNTDTSKVAAAQTDIDNLSQSEEVSVTAKTGDVNAAMKGISEKLETLQALAVIDIVMNLPTGLLESPLFTAISDTETAVDRITAMTGQEIPQAAGLINTLYSEAWTKSRDDIANVIIELERLDVAQANYEDAARTAFQVAAVTGKEPLEVLAAMNALVSNDVVKSFGEAGDFITKGFQEGLDRSGDFLDSISEYSKTLNDSDISAGGFFEILNSGLAAGAQNTDKLIDGFKEMTNLSREEVAIRASSGEETDRTRALSDLGLMDEAEAYSAGQITGDQFSAGVLDGLRAVEDPAEQRRLALAIFSPTMVEEAGLPALLAIDLSNSSELQAAWEGVAASAATALTDNLNGAIAEFIALIETELVTALDETFDLSGRMDIAKEQFQDFIAAIREGKGFGEAIEIAFGVEGVDTALANIERVFGNLLIGILEAVAFIQDPTGTTDADKGTRAEIARFATGQLAFDLQIANAEEIPGILQTAVSRGVTGEALGGAIKTAIVEATAAQDFTALGNLMRGGLEAGLFNQETFDGFAAEMQSAFKFAVETGDFDLAAEVATGLDDPAMFDMLRTRAQEAYDSLDFSTFSGIADSLNDPAMLEQARLWGDSLREQVQTSLEGGDLLGAQRIARELDDPEISAAVEEYKNTHKTAMQSVEQSTQINLEGVRDELGFTGETLVESESAIERWKDKYIEMINLVGERIKYVNEQFTDLAHKADGATSGGTGGTGDGGFAVGGTATGTALVGERGPELATFPSPAGIVNAANTSVLMRAVDSILASMAGGGGQTIINNNFVMNNTNHMQNQAQADALGYRAGTALRGF